MPPTLHPKSPEDSNLQCVGLVRRKRDGFDPVAVRITDERRIIPHAIMRTQARRAVGAAARLQRRSMKSVDRAGGFCAKADMATALGRHLRHLTTQVDPEFGIGFSETDGPRPRDQSNQTERRQRGFIEARGPFELADADGDMVDHLNASHRDVIPGRCEASNPESRDSGSGPSDHPGMTEVSLTPALPISPTCK